MSFYRNINRLLPYCVTTVFTSVCLKLCLNLLMQVKRKWIFPGRKLLSSYTERGAVGDTSLAMVLAEYFVCCVAETRNYMLYSGFSLWTFRSVGTFTSDLLCKRPQDMFFQEPIISALLKYTSQKDCQQKELNSWVVHLFLYERVLVVNCHTILWTFSLCIT